jgi:hypothetical protein
MRLLYHIMPPPPSTREMRNAHILIRKPEGKRPLGRAWHKLKGILKIILKKEDVTVWTELNWSRIGSSKHDNDKEFVGQMSDYQIFKDSAPLVLLYHFT